MLTKKVREPLDYEEFVIFNDLIDYVATGQLLTKDKRKREIIIAMKPKIEEYKQMLKQLEERR